MALVTALNALEIGVGDEVLVGPYTFIASVNTIFAAGALADLRRYRSEQPS